MLALAVFAPARSSCQVVQLIGMSGFGLRLDGGVLGFELSIWGSAAVFVSGKFCISGLPLWPCGSNFLVWLIHGSELSVGTRISELLM